MSSNTSGLMETVSNKRGRPPKFPGAMLRSTLTAPGASDRTRRNFVYVAEAMNALGFQLCPEGVSIPDRYSWLRGRGGKPRIRVLVQIGMTVIDEGEEVAQDLARAICDRGVSENLSTEQAERLLRYARQPEPIDAR